MRAAPMMGWVPGQFLQALHYPPEKLRLYCIEVLSCSRGGCLCPLARVQQVEPVMIVSLSPQFEMWSNVVAFNWPAESSIEALPSSYHPYSICSSRPYDSLAGLLWNPNSSSPVKACSR